MNGWLSSLYPLCPLFREFRVRLICRLLPGFVALIAPPATPTTIKKQNEKRAQPKISSSENVSNGVPLGFVFGTVQPLLLHTATLPLSLPTPPLMR
jgi:hypothetical protein